MRAFYKRLMCMLLVFLLGAGGSLPALAAMNYDYTGIVYDIEAEDMTILDTSRLLYTSGHNDVLSGGRGIGVVYEDKTEPAQSASASLELEFYPEQDGRYYIWLRHTASKSNQAGQSIFMAIGDGNYTNTGLLAEPDAPLWIQIAAIDGKAGERSFLRFIPRQKAGIILDRFIITTNPSYVPTDEDLGILYDGQSSTASGMSKMAGAVALTVGSSNAYVNYQQVPIDEENPEITPILKNDRTYLPTRFVAEALGAQVDFDEAGGAAILSTDAGSVRAVIGDDAIYKDGERIAISDPIFTQGDRMYLPVRAVCEALGKYAFYDNDLELIILSDYPNIYDSEEDSDTLLTITKNIIYDRPTGAEMIADMQEVSPGDEHPRLLLHQSDFDRIIEDAKTDTVLSGMIDKVVRANESTKNQTQATTRYDGSGDAGNMLEPARQAKEIMFVMSFLYKVTGDPAYAERAYIEAENVCAFPTWRPGHFLNVGEMAFGVALTYDWLYDYLTPERRKTLEEGLYNQAVVKGIGAYNGTSDEIDSHHGTHGRSGWTKAKTNWNAVCNAGLTMSSIALANVYPEDCEWLLGNIINSIELGVEDYAPDGGYSEGPGYWSFGTNYLVWFLASLESAMGTTYGIAESPGLRQTGYFPTYMESPYGQFNFHDCGEDKIDTSTLFWFANYYDDPVIAGARYQDIMNGTKSVSPKDIMWYNPDNIDTSAEWPLDRMFKGISTASMRSSFATDTPVYTGLHAGNNTANHGNLDTGTFVLDAGGVRWFVDLGSDNYNLPGYFSGGTTGQRWNYYRMRAEGQNTLVINPDDDPDQIVNSDSPIVDFVSKPRGAYAVADMTPAYADDASAAKRGLFLTNNRNTVIVQDEVTLKTSSEVWWFAHINSNRTNVEIAPDQKSAILTQGGQRLWVGIVTRPGDTALEQQAGFTLMDADPLPTSPESNSSEYGRGSYKKLAIHAQGVTSFDLAVVMQLLEPGESEPQNFTYSFTDIADWSVADGEMVTPLLEEITVNGTPVASFSPNRTSYTFPLPAGTTDMPIIGYTAAEGCGVEVTMPSSLPGQAVLKVYVEDEPYNVKYYYVTLREERDVEITASDWENDVNTPEKSYDGDYSTRWSAEGEAWIMYTFREPQTLSCVSLAFWKAAARKARIKIEVSADGSEFETVYDGYSTSDTETLEDFTFTPRSVKAVRVNCYGNTSEETTASVWNSILEVDFK